MEMPDMGIPPDEWPEEHKTCLWVLDHLRRLIKLEKVEPDISIYKLEVKGIASLDQIMASGFKPKLSMVLSMMKILAERFNL